MAVGAAGVPPGVLPRRERHREGGDTEKARERQKPPSPVDRLSQGVELILKNEVKPHCSQGGLCFSTLHSNLSPSPSLAA